MSSFKPTYELRCEVARDGREFVPAAWYVELEAEVERLEAQVEALREVLQEVDACYAVNGYLTQFVAEKVSAAALGETEAE
jgi:hypothetical protein